MSRSPSRGFTLVEMVVAIAILAMSLPALYSVFANSAYRAGHDRDRREAVQLAQSLLAKIGVERPLSEASESGQSGIYSYSITTTATGAVSPEKPIVPYLAKIKVSWGGSAGRALELQTLKLASEIPQ